MQDPRAEQVFKFNIEMPNDTNRKDGDMVPLTIRMFLGQTEIKVDTIFEGETKRQSFTFSALDPEHRQRIESRHAKKQVTVPEPVAAAVSVLKNSEKLKPE